jgi:uncharacterized protein YbjT (DUF2867 family)
MSPDSDARPRLVVIGGCGGLVGRAVLEECRSEFRIRSVHRRRAPEDALEGVEFVRADLSEPGDWRAILQGADTVLTLAWYRSGRDRRFASLAKGLESLITAAAHANVRRFVYLSVPPAPDALEARLPYLVRRRQVERHLSQSGLNHVILRPSMLFGSGDRLATVMLRTIHRWGRLPLFDQGLYHLSPLATADLARIVRREASTSTSSYLEFGGPRRWTYRALADRMFEVMGRPPKYLHLSAKGGERLARMLEWSGFTLLYAYEVEWLVSDRLGLAAYSGLAQPMRDIDPFLVRSAELLFGSNRH